MTLTQKDSAFAQAYKASAGAVLAQASASDTFRRRMTSAALAMATALTMSLTANVHEAHAQDNQVVRTAKDAIGAIIGGALGSQVGKGNGKTAAAALGTAAGVWAAEAMQEDSSYARPGTYSTNSVREIAPSWTPGWGPSPTMQNNAGANNAPAARLPSGTTALSPDRMGKLSSIEGQFLAARDAYARAMYVSDQAEDDLRLSPGSRELQSARNEAGGKERTAFNTYEKVRTDFVSAVEYLGKRGYDVHAFAYSHHLAGTRVTSNDMARRDLAQAASYQQPERESYVDRENSYASR